MKGKVIEFIRTKDFKFIEEIGQGGTGRTVLLEDEIINERFVCKKYSPIYKEYQELFFKNFKDEIKLLHLIYHKNIVRVFNYYLYPEKHTGYIIMEFVKGLDISEFIRKNPDLLSEIFIQVVEGFVHLEENKILHRDIRPENILVSNEGYVKIIDFGFSKKIDFEADFDKSISLNWRYSPPQDFDDKIYDFRTEVYFLGKLFEEIIIENNFQNFTYLSLIKKMIIHKYDQRIKSFFDIQREIISGKSIGIEFSEEEKNIYLLFAIDISNIFSKISHDAEYITDIENIILGLENLYRNSMLETNIQNIQALPNCFVKGSYTYFPKQEVSVTIVKDFLFFLKTTSIDKQKVIINNLWQRLDKIERTYSEFEVGDLPF